MKRKLFLIILGSLLGNALSLAAAYAMDNLPPPSATTQAIHSASPPMLAPLPKFQPNNQSDNQDEPLSAYYHPYLPEPTNIPPPTSTHLPAKILSLKDAILLALRFSPVVQNSELQRVVDKYAVELAHYAFEPQFSLTATANYAFQPPGGASYSVTPQVTLLSPYGTNIQLSHTNTLNGTAGITTLAITQPFLQGFGYVNRIPYLDALDNEQVAKLNFKTAIITTIVAVVTSYRTLVEDYNNLEAQLRTLQATKESVHEYELQVKYGKIAPSQLVEQQANLASVQLAYTQQQNQLQEDYQTFLSSLGLVPTANLKIDTKIDYSSNRIPDRNTAIHIALLNNMAYLSDVIQLRAKQRAIIADKNANAPQFNATVTQTVGTGVAASSTTTTTGTTTPTVTGDGTTPTSTTLGLSLTVPIDNFKGKVQLEDDSVALQQAKIDLEQAKENLIRQVITQLNSIDNLRLQIINAELTVKLQQQTLDNARLRARYGKATTFEVVQDVNTLLSDQISLIASKINYLNGITQLNQILGVTLDVWEIKLRY